METDIIKNAWGVTYLWNICGVADNFILEDDLELTIY